MPGLARNEVSDDLAEGVGEQAEFLPETKQRGWIGARQFLERDVDAEAVVVG